MPSNYIKFFGTILLKRMDVQHRLKPDSEVITKIGVMFDNENKWVFFSFCVDKQYSIYMQGPNQC
jgi:hypothetical protein